MTAEKHLLPWWSQRNGKDARCRICWRRGEAPLGPCPREPPLGQALARRLLGSGRVPHAVPPPGPDRARAAIRCPICAGAGRRWRWRVRGGGGVGGSVVEVEGAMRWSWCTHARERARYFFIRLAQQVDRNGQGPCDRGSKGQRGLLDTMTSLGPECHSP